MILKRSSSPAEQVSFRFPWAEKSAQPIWSPSNRKLVAQDYATQPFYSKRLIQGWTAPNKTHWLSIPRLWKAQNQWAAHQGQSLVRFRAVLDIHCLGSSRSQLKQYSFPKSFLLGYWISCCMSLSMATTLHCLPFLNPLISQACSWPHYYSSS